MTSSFLPSTYRPALFLLCTYGFFKEFKPSEPYLTEYLTGPDYVNLPKDEVYQSVYPIWSYSYFLLLIPVFLLTDLLRYKPVIIFEGAAYVATWLVILYTDTILSMQFMQLLYGVATSTEVAYYTYIYAKVPKEHYKTVSSFTRAFILMGKFSSGLVSQLLDSFSSIDYRQLNFISLGSVSLAFALSLFLPGVKTSVYFHRKLDQEAPSAVTVSPTYGTTGTASASSSSSSSSSAAAAAAAATATATTTTPADDQQLQVKPDQQAAARISFRTALPLIWHELVSSYRNGYILKWSAWVAISTCINYQVGNYIQPLWEDILPFDGGEEGSDPAIYNGAVEAATTLLGALTVFSVGFLNVPWQILGDYAILVVASVGGAILIVMSQAKWIWVAYIGYVLLRMAHQLLMTVASFEMARTIKDLDDNRDSFGLVFGLNTFVGVGLESLLTFCVADANGLALPIRQQFVVYGAIYVAAGVAFAGSFIAARLFCRESVGSAPPVCRVSNDA